MKRILGLDSIRFICAFIVVVGHFGFPWPDFMNETGTGVFSYVGKITGLMFNGPAAVIVFFIISGFCIQYPFRFSTKIDLYSFYTRRLLRIGIPAVIAISLCMFFKADLKPPLFGIFWSILCEVIYYILYPLLFLFRKLIKWEHIFLLSFTATMCYIFFNREALNTGNYNYGAFGYMTWFIGLPSWIAGCWLSENYENFKQLKSIQIWGVRTVLVIGMMILMVIKFHTSSVFASYTITLNIFAIVACTWLGFEIMYFQAKKPSNLLESAGKWSYSLYIMHPLAVAVYDYFGLLKLVLTHNSILIFSSFLLAYIFYLVVEKPSHRFSVLISKIFSKKTEPIAT